VSSAGAAADWRLHLGPDGWLYLGVVLDLCTGRIVGWEMADRRGHELAFAASSSPRAGNAKLRSLSCQRYSLVECTRRRAVRRYRLSNDPRCPKSNCEDGILSAKVTSIVLYRGAKALTHLSRALAASS
jgi:hypothetical protein